MSQDNKKLSREEVAKTEVGHTEITRRCALLLAVFFLTVVSIIPMLQIWNDVRNYRSGVREDLLPQPAEIARGAGLFADAYSRAEGSFLHRIFPANAALLAEINRFEDAITDESVITDALLPPVQAVLTKRLGAGNEQAYTGRDGWLFYRADIEYVTGPGFLDERQLHRRAAQGSEWKDPPQPDPRKAILNFHKQLAEQGITLIVMPTPVKPVIHPEMFTARYNGARSPVHNSSYQQFIDDLAAEGVLIFDPSELLAEQRIKNGVPVYLETDTHWRPEAAATVAKSLAEFIEKHNLPASSGKSPFQRLPVEVSNIGDIAGMLRLPEAHTVFTKENVVVEQILTSGNELLRPIRSAEVLLLGDSFANIYSHQAMGWGQSAGFAEQLSYALRLPVDSIVRNDNASYATRQLLSNELARGRNRLENKQVVVYQFATRELAFGDWKLLDMVLGEPQPSQFIMPEPGTSIIVTGTIQELSTVPQPRATPYSDHVMSLHITDLETEEDDIEGAEALVYVMSMIDNEHTPAAQYRAGDRITFKLRSWYDVADDYDAVKRSELDDPMLRLEDPCWGEEIQ